MTSRLFGLVLAGGLLLAHAGTAKAQVGVSIGSPYAGVGLAVGAPYYATPYPAVGPYAAPIAGPMASAPYYSPAYPGYIYPTTSWYTTTNYTPGLPIASSVWPYMAPAAGFGAYGMLPDYGFTSYVVSPRGFGRWAW